jgi:GNAT superfamily N-acetyltransferase
MIDVRRLADVVDRGAAEREIERIFFAASGTQSFADEAARAVFRERWLGRYLAHDADKVFVALDGGGTVVGYLVGSFDDPAQTARFSDIGYFAELAHVTARYPAHLHVNLDERVRGAGVGSRLVEAFCAEASAAKMPGVHIVTGRGLRNVAFYQRLGFRERGAAVSNGRDVVMLCRELA